MAPAPLTVGGYAPVDLRARELVAVLKAAVAHVTPVARGRARLLAAERQVVAGTNYRIVLQLRDGSRWQVIVWRRLDRIMEVTQATRITL